jgi:hypothetical protein
MFYVIKRAALNVLFVAISKEKRFSFSFKMKQKLSEKRLERGVGYAWMSASPVYYDSNVASREFHAVTILD